MSTWFGSTVATLAFVAASTAAIYVTTVACIRLVGRRTVAQMSAFDAVVTVALGSLLASTAVSAEVSYPEGAVALVTLLGLQVLVAWLRQRFRPFRRVLGFSPEVLSDGGAVDLPGRPWSSQMTLDELRSELRKQGVVQPTAAALVVLEPDGTVSVLTDDADVRRARQQLSGQSSAAGDAEG